jgi:hypothetical protein
MTHELAGVIPGFDRTLLEDSRSIASRIWTSVRST